MNTINDILRAAAAASTPSQQLKTAFSKMGMAVPKVDITGSADSRTAWDEMSRIDGVPCEVRESAIEVSLLAEQVDEICGDLANARQEYEDINDRQRKRSSKGKPMKENCSAAALNKAREAVSTLLEQRKKLRAEWRSSSAKAWRAVAQHAATLRDLQ